MTEEEQGAANLAFFYELCRLEKAGKSATVLRNFDAYVLNALRRDFPTFHHAGQMPPPGDWRNWVLSAGRGFGKTRAGAEWVLGLVRGELSDLRIALVGGTVAEARSVMLEGPSGLFALAEDQEITAWHPSRGLIEFSSGAQAQLYSGAHGEGLRGPEHHYAWCDELAKWKQGDAAWDNLQMGLRAGDHPQCLVTTTPRPSRLMNRVLVTPHTIVTGGRTVDNPNLGDSYLQSMKAFYGGTRLARQELDGEMLTDAEGTLWGKDLLAKSRAEAAAHYTRIIVGVDPPASANGTCGIIVVGKVDSMAHVIADCSIAGVSPERWARAVAGAVDRYGASLVVAEANQGGDMVKSVLHGADAAMPVKLTHAKRSKTQRAEPVAQLFEQGKAFLCGEFLELEEQLAGMIAGGGYEGPGRSPDRADAMVWALSVLMDKEIEPSIRVL